MDEFLQALSDEAILALPDLFEFWAMPHQLPPDTTAAGRPWKTWVVLGGRGAGKTRAGAEWVRRMVEGARPADPGRLSRVALVGETLDQAREVMVFGESGLMEISPPDRRPVWEASRRRLVWPNGAVAQVFSAHDPESLRGPQFDGAWLDELGKWPRAEEAWTTLQFALRLGRDPRQVVTTTPHATPVLRAILAAESTVTTHAGTDANRANLAASFLAEVQARFGGTRLGRRELDGIMPEDQDGALWTAAMIDAGRRPKPERFSRIVVAIDPPASGHAGSDACGIVVAGAVTEGHPRDWHAWVLEDASVEGASPHRWAQAAVAAARRHAADRIVAEVNMGGDMIEAILRGIDTFVPFRALHAGKGKVSRAEPVAALYEQGRVHHLRGLEALEDQMCRMTRAGFTGRGSPDRVDALVWALTELMVGAQAGFRDPRVRAI
ncbi:MAG: terminase family protein [Rhodobacteraceae bacterium]|nr:terminase family protein [Paracoccaceae bacterium]